jgi:hypothetical protein
MDVGDVGILCVLSAILVAFTQSIAMCWCARSGIGTKLCQPSIVCIHADVGVI